MIGRYANIDKYRQLLPMKELILVFLGAAFLITSYLLSRSSHILPANILALLAVALLGGPIIAEAIQGLRQKKLNVDELVSLAIIASVMIGEYLPAAIVALIMVIGSLAEEFVAQKSRRAIDALTRLNPEQATVIRQGREMLVPLAEIQLGERVVIRSGERVPVDGVVLRGSALVNQASLTGEAMPLEKGLGDQVYAGSVSYSGMMELEAKKVGQDTTLGKLIQLVRDAEKQKAPILRIADGYAQYFTPIMIGIGLAVFLFTGNLQRAITVLIVGCPCAFILSAPTAIVSALGNASQKGILVKSGAFIEEISRIDTVVFDKTGTITTGQPTVMRTVALGGVSREYVLLVAAAAEKCSTHPLARAIGEAANQLVMEIPEAEVYTDVPGLGVEAKIKDKIISVGALSSGEREDTADAKIVTVQENGQTIGQIYIQDQMRRDVPFVIKSLRDLGIEKIQLFTGDNHYRAAVIAGDSGIRDFYSNLLPEQKLKRVRDLQKAGHKVAVVGDGINDAPSLRAANIGIAMGAMGTDVAMEAADVALMGDDLTKLPYFINLGRATVKTINLNIFFALIFNGLALAASMAGFLSPIMGALVHNAGSVAVVVNSALFTRFRSSPKAPLSQSWVPRSSRP